MTSGDFDQALSAARQALQDAIAGAAPAAGPSSGVGADGLIQVTAEGQRLTSVTVDPRAMRLPAEEFGAELLSAVNAALASGDPAPVPEAAALPDPAALSRQLEELQNQSLRQMARYTQSISEVMAALKQRG
ncbi:YbaB/EbfC family DNA-binding protein [Asanoa ferruginea]|nr:YbaB/EbfC family DNA-binding protein [Asanoa ferruginea]